MKKILFRAKTIDLPQWKHGAILPRERNKLLCLVLRRSRDGEISYSDALMSSVGRNTEIVDCGNVDIYEGDIVQVGDKIMPVIYERGCFYTPWNTSKYRLGGWDTYAIKIIGNITDNPELIEKINEPHA